MFDTTLVASNRRREVRRKLATLPAALALHAMALGLVMTGQLWAVQPVLEPDVVVAFVDFTPPSPPPPPPPPPEGSGANDAAKATDVNPPTEPVQPKVIPVQPPKVGAPESGGQKDGVIGGVNGGSKNGVIGGVVAERKVEPPPLVADDVPVRPGEGIVDPVNVFRRDPIYPELARKAHLQGVVIVDATIDRQGNVVETKVLKDLGLGCGAAVVEALRTWKYKPATFNDRPVSIVMTVTVTFHLTGAE